MERPDNQTFGEGGHLFSASCYKCGRRAHFFGEDQDGIRDALRASGWKAERTGIIHPEVGDLAQFRCAECAGTR